MKYSVNYSNKLKSLDGFDEIIIRYEQQEEALPQFLEAHLEQDIVLSIDNVKDFCYYQRWGYLNALYEKYNNFCIRFYQTRDFSEIDAELKAVIESLEVPYFFGMLASNFDELHYLLSLGAKQAYLVEDICFDLLRAKQVCSSYGVTIRAFPNVAQACVRSTPALKKFFIRPSDVPAYEEYIDILEFWGSEDRQEVLLQIYKRGNWMGDLSVVILDLNYKIESQYIIPQFATMRIHCERSCMKGGTCSCCERILSIGEKLKSKGIMLTTKKQH